MTLARHSQIWLCSWRLLEDRERSLRKVPLLFLSLVFRFFSFWHDQQCHCEIQKSKPMHGSRIGL
jgi:hypothetical protein